MWAPGGRLHFVEVKHCLRIDPDFHPATLLGRQRRQRMRQAALLFLERLQQGEWQSEDSSGKVAESIAGELRSGKFPEISFDLALVSGGQIVQYLEGEL
ncbi:MAG: hypothetical protein K1X75_05050 [Leptospirales bacterium]|nr:hypothetical protein [Leptospirales bacterium]